MKRGRPRLSNELRVHHKEKICCTCKILKPRAQFDLKEGIYLSADCKKCVRAKQRIRRAEIKADEFLYRKYRDQCNRTFKAYAKARAEQGRPVQYTFAIKCKAIAQLC